MGCRQSPTVSTAEYYQVLLYTQRSTHKHTHKVQSETSNENHPEPGLCQPKMNPLFLAHIHTRQGLAWPAAAKWAASWAHQWILRQAGSLILRSNLWLDYSQNLNIRTESYKGSKPTKEAVSQICKATSCILFILVDGVDKVQKAWTSLHCNLSFPSLYVILQLKNMRRSRGDQD